MNTEHAVIVGGASGIGFATAMAFAKDNRVVTIIGRDKTKLDAALLELCGAAEGAIADATDRAGLDALFAHADPIDHLFVAASSGGGAGAFATLDIDSVRRGFEAKFWAQVNVAQSALRRLRSGGSITFVTVASSRVANPGTSGLGAINGALERMVPTLARELAPLRVNAVSPGVIDTPWWADKPAKFFEEQAGRSPLGRAGRQDEVASAIVFLATNAFITGVVLDVDGGLHLM